MPTTRSRAGISSFAPIAALACGLLLGDRADAGAMSSIIDYSTTGTISDVGVTGNQVVSFQSIDNGVTRTPSLAFPPFTGSFPIPAGYGSALPLGELVVVPSTGSDATTYHNTPFQIEATLDSIGGVMPTAGTTTVHIPGVLNGAVARDGSSTLVATLSGNPVYGPPFDTGREVGTPVLLPPFQYNLTLPVNTFTLSNGDGAKTETPFSAIVIASGPSNTPEPAVLTMFVLAGASLIARRWFKVKT